MRTYSGVPDTAEATAAPNEMLRTPHVASPECNDPYSIAKWPLSEWDRYIFADLSSRLDQLTEPEWGTWHRINDAINLAIIEGALDDPWRAVIEQMEG